MKNFLTLKFWFSANPGDLTLQAQAGFLILIVILAAIGAYSWWWRKENAKGLYRKIYGRVMTLGFTNAGLGLLLLFFEYEAVPILSMRFWPLVWFFSMVGWGWLIGKDIQRIPQIRAQIEEERKIKKYIP